MYGPVTLVIWLTCSLLGFQATHACGDKAEPFDLVGFQECQDVALVLRDAGLEDAFGTVVGKREIVIDGHCKQELGCRAIALAYRKSRWALLQNGITEVAEDAPLQILRSA